MQVILKNMVAVALMMIAISGCSNKTPVDPDTNLTKDTTPPVIHLLGDNPMTVAQGGTFTDPGAVVTDNVDANRTITGTGSIDTATVGTYTLTYTARDAAGNEAKALTRTVEVKDLTPPAFASEANVSVPENQTSALTLHATDANPPITYAISGGDAGDFDLNTTTGVVTFKTAPDYETKAFYTFTASAADSYGNVATQEVNIAILDIAEGLKKTGQTKSYDEDGNEIDTSLARDDGHYQTGVDFNYTRDDAKEIVTDHVTGLQWQDDDEANTTEKQWLTDDNYDKCTNDGNDTACYDTSGDTAATYCANLSLGGYTDWRLPTAKELDGIVDYGRRNPAIAPTFQHTATDDYWSSSTYEGYH